MFQVRLASLPASVIIISTWVELGVGVQEMTMADNETKELLYPDVEGSLDGLFQHRFHQRLDFGASQKSIDALKSGEVFGYHSIKQLSPRKVLWQIHPEEKKAGQDQDL